MGIFDNAKSIMIGDKEVKSITIGEGTVYEKAVEPTPSTNTVSFTLLDYTTGNPVQGVQVPIYKESSSGGSPELIGVSGNSGSAGGCTISNVPDGAYYVDGDFDVKLLDGTPTESRIAEITVDSTHNSFTLCIEHYESTTQQENNG